MKRQGLITYQSRDYEHGMKLTNIGQKRLKRLTISVLLIDQPKVWDKKWQLVFYDIPETEKYQRNFLTARLRQLGFQQLQKSIWIHPFPCRQEVEVLTEYIAVRKYVSYVEISHIDSKAELKVRFAKILKWKA